MASNADTETITRGARVEVVDIAGRKLRRRAISGIEPGHDFRVVWVCHEEEWQAAVAESRDPEAVPWPADDVSLLDGDEDDENETAFRVVRDATSIE